MPRSAPLTISWASATAPGRSSARRPTETRASSSRARRARVMAAATSSKRCSVASTAAPRQCRCGPCRARRGPPRQDRHRPRRRVAWRQPADQPARAESRRLWACASQGTRVQRNHSERHSRRPDDSPRGPGPSRPGRRAGGRSLSGGVVASSPALSRRGTRSLSRSAGGTVSIP